MIPEANCVQVSARAHIVRIWDKSTKADGKFAFCSFAFCVLQFCVSQFRNFAISRFPFGFHFRPKSRLRPLEQLQAKPD